MKRTVLLILVLSLCLTMAACMKMEGTPGSSGGNGNGDGQTVIDPCGEPEIVLDNNDVEQEDRYDATGKAVGSFRYTSGTNCGVYGVVRIEWLDLNGNVLHSISPQLAGGTLGAGSFGQQRFEITTVWETTDAGANIEYILIPYSCGKLQTKIVGNNGGTEYLEMYNRDGYLCRTVSPVTPGNRLEIEYFDNNYCQITERCIVEDTLYAQRKMYLRASGSLLADLWLTNDYEMDNWFSKLVQVQVKDANGNLLKTYTHSAEDTVFDVQFDSNGEVLRVWEYRDRLTLLEECYDQKNDTVVFRMQHFYTGDEYSHTEMVIHDGQVVLTPSEYKGYYKKVEFYDAQGVLQKTAEATEQKPYICLSWDQYDRECEIMWIDTEGNNLGYDVYKPR